MQVSITVAVDNGDHGFTRVLLPDEFALNSVLFDFNPSSNEQVTIYKALCAALIVELHTFIHRADVNSQQRRNAAAAITEVEAAQMRAVKSLFAK